MERNTRSTKKSTHARSLYKIGEIVGSQGNSFNRIPLKRDAEIVSGKALPENSLLSNMIYYLIQKSFPLWRLRIWKQPGLIWSYLHYTETFGWEGEIYKDLTFRVRSQ